MTEVDPTVADKQVSESTTEELRARLQDIENRAVIMFGSRLYYIEAQRERRRIVEELMRRRMVLEAANVDLLSAKRLMKQLG